MNITPEYYITLVATRRRRLQVTELNTTLLPEYRKKLNHLAVSIQCGVPSGILRRAKRVDADATNTIFRHLMLSVTGHLALHPDEFMIHYDSLGLGLRHELADLSPQDRRAGFHKFHKNGLVDPRCIKWDDFRSARGD